jgi:hypothetical protein
MNWVMVRGLAGALKSLGLSTGPLSQLSPDPRKLGISKAARLTSLPSMIERRRAGDTVMTAGILWLEYPYVVLIALGPGPVS